MAACRHQMLAWRPGGLREREPELKEARSGGPTYMVDEIEFNEAVSGRIRGSLKSCQANGEIECHEAARRSTCSSSPIMCKHSWKSDIATF